MYGCVVFSEYYTIKEYLGVLYVGTEEKKVPDTFKVHYVVYI
jgi:hypothetical protein